MTTQPKGALLIGPNPAAQLRWARANADRLAEHLFEKREEVRGIYARGGYVEGWVTAPIRVIAPTITPDHLRGTFTRGWDWRPGELSLAHGGVLLMQGVTEFSAEALLEIQWATRLKCVPFRVEDTGIDAPADFVIIATAAGCPCGDSRWITTPPPNTPMAPCYCPTSAIAAHLARIPQWLRDACDVVGPEVYDR